MLDADTYSLLSALDIAREVNAGQLCAVEVAAAALELAEQRGARYGAFTCLAPEHAIADARPRRAGSARRPQLVAHGHRSKILISASECARQLHQRRRTAPAESSRGVDSESDFRMCATVPQPKRRERRVAMPRRCDGPAGQLFLWSIFLGSRMPLMVGSKAGPSCLTARRPTSCCSVVTRSERPLPRKVIVQCSRVVIRFLKPTT